MNETWQTLLTLGDKLAAHVLLSAAALALGIAVALPLAVWASRSRGVARVSLGFASLVQTIPALALLALFFPVLLSLRAVFGPSLPTLGFLLELVQNRLAVGVVDWNNDNLCQLEAGSWKVGCKISCSMRREALKSNAWSHDRPRSILASSF